MTFLVCLSVWMRQNQRIADAVYSFGAIQKPSYGVCVIHEVQYLPCNTKQTRPSRMFLSLITTAQHP